MSRKGNFAPCHFHTVNCSQNWERLKLKREYQIYEICLTSKKPNDFHFLKYLSPGKGSIIPIFLDKVMAGPSNERWDQKTHFQNKVADYGECKFFWPKLDGRTKYQCQKLIFNQEALTDFHGLFWKMELSSIRGVRVYQYLYSGLLIVAVCIYSALGLVGDSCSPVLFSMLLRIILKLIKGWESDQTCLGQIVYGSEN